MNTYLNDKSFGSNTLLPLWGNNGTTVILIIIAAIIATIIIITYYIIITAHISLFSVQIRKEEDYLRGEMPAPG